MKDPILQNQALAQHMLYFDQPRVKSLFETTPDGKRRRIGYADEREGAELLDFGRVRFNFYAPDAESVRMHGWGGSMPGDFDFQRDTDGYWSLELDNVQPGFHYCHFYVNGVKTLNQLMPFGYGGFTVCNFFEMPDRDADFFLLQDVPHGDVRMELYTSPVNGRVKAAWVYCPPGYDAEPDRKYPVLYIQHGVGENETGWIWQGKLNYICDNLIAEGKMEPMLIVMNSGYAFVDGEINMFMPGDFDRELCEACIPAIDAKYRTLTDREHRAIAGLSLGSAQAFSIGITHMEDLFSAIGVFSGGIAPKSMFGAYDLSEYFEDAERFRKLIKVLFVSGGESEGMIAPNQKVLDELKERGIEGVHYTHPGYHEWDVWRYSLREYLQLLFR